MQGPHFIHQAGFEETDHATIDAFVQASAGKLEGQDGDVGGSGPVVFGLMFADRPAGELEDLEGPDDPAPVARM